MKKLISDFLTRNSLGLMLATANLTALYFFLWYLEGGLHNPTAIGCVDGKFTLISTFRFYYGELLTALSDLVGNFFKILNLPALSLSNFVSDAFFTGKPDCISDVYPGWKYSWFYKTRIGLNVLFVVAQWLSIGVILKRLCKLVKDS